MLLCRPPALSHLHPCGRRKRRGLRAGEGLFLLSLCGWVSSSPLTASDPFPRAGITPLAPTCILLQRHPGQELCWASPPIVVAPASPLPVSPPCDPCPHPNIPFAFFIFIFFPLFCFLCVRLRHSRPSSSSKTIVRGSKASKDGSLTWLLDEFENMSVSRSNSLRRDSPPFPPRRHQLHQENGLSQGLTSAPAQEDAGRSRKSRPGAGHEVEQGKERPRHKEEHHGQHQSQQCPAPKAAPGGRPPPDYPKAPLERDSKQERVLRRERPEAAEKRPKSTLGAGGSSPPSPRDKRPLSGPSIRTPNIPISEGVMKTAQQTGRAFNTYPRAETDPGPQVTCPPAPRGCSSSSSSNCSSSSSCLKPIKKASPRCWASSG